jgi:hypothetical protein
MSARLYQLHSGRHPTIEPFMLNAFRASLVNAMILYFCLKNSQHIGKQQGGHASDFRRRLPLIVMNEQHQNWGRVAGGGGAV